MKLKKICYNKEIMSWILFTGLSVLSRAIYGVMSKVLSNKVLVSAPTQALSLTIAGTFMAILISPFLGGINLTTPTINWLTVLLVVLGQGLGNIVYFKGMKKLTNGTAQITFSSILVFNTFLSLIFLDLNLSPLNIFGLILLSIAILIVVSGKIEFNLQGILLMMGSAFLFSVFQIASTELSRQVTAATYLVIAYGGSALTIFIIQAKTIIPEIKKIQKKTTIILIPLLTVIPSLGNFIFAYYAYRIAPEPAKVAILLTSQVVVAVLLSYIFLGEKDNLIRKIIAAVLVIIAAILIKG